MTILEHLKEYSYSTIPFHMPGGKRSFSSDLPYRWDVTETDGTDDLHHPASFILEAQNRASALWHSEASLLLVNGSTGGILSAVRATGSGPILIARNCHKSVYNAVELCHRKVFYLLPKAGMIPGAIQPDEVDHELTLHPEIQTVLITSPTYEGIVSDISSIASICHRRHAVLIVDEAHGAHLGFHPFFPESAVTLDADIIIQSLHKTLPALTQTAIIHCKKEWEQKLAKQNTVFETSSPSFLLLASADECFTFLNNPIPFQQYADRLGWLRKNLQNLKHLKLYLPPDGVIYDPGKIVIITNGTEISGRQLASILREKYKIEVEMSAPEYIIAMTSVCDTDAMFSVFFTALSEIDDSLSLPNKCLEPSFQTQLPPKQMEIFEATEAKSISIPLSESIGKISSEALWIYPPGIPFLLPGEQITDDTLQKILFYQSKGFSVRFSNPHDEFHIMVIDKTAFKTDL